jgi:hypothetical protein
MARTRAAAALNMLVEARGSPSSGSVAVQDGTCTASAVAYVLFTANTLLFAAITAEWGSAMVLLVCRSDLKPLAVHVALLAAASVSDKILLRWR